MVIAECNGIDWNLSYEGYTLIHFKYFSLAVEIFFLQNIYLHEPPTTYTTITIELNQKTRGVEGWTCYHADALDIERDGGGDARGEKGSIGIELCLALKQRRGFGYE